MRFCKGCNIQTAFVSMLEKMLIVRDKKEVCGAISTDLSKVFRAN